MDNASAIQASDAVAADWATGDADDATTTRTCALAYTDGVR